MKNNEKRTQKMLTKKNFLFVFFFYIFRKKKNSFQINFQAENIFKKLIFIKRFLNYLNFLN